MRIKIYIGVILGVRDPGCLRGAETGITYHRNHLICERKGLCTVHISCNIHYLAR